MNPQHFEKTITLYHQEVERLEQEIERINREHECRVKEWREDRDRAQKTRGEDYDEIKRLEELLKKANEDLRMSRQDVCMFKARINGLKKLLEAEQARNQALEGKVPDL